MGQNNKVKDMREQHPADHLPTAGLHRSGASAVSGQPPKRAQPDAERRTTGPCLGIIKLDTAFPRPLGDVGNANSHRFPFIAECVPGAYARDIVGKHSEQEIIARSGAFVAAGRRLVERGATVIGTSCGFLTPLQARLARELPVPVALSALLQVRMLEPVFGPGRVGVITFDSATLSEAHKNAADVPDDTPVAGLAANSPLRRALLNGADSIDHNAARLELAALARRQLRRHPGLRALVLECTNLPPYRAALRQAVGLPVYDVNTLLDWIGQGLLQNAGK